MGMTTNGLTLPAKKVNHYQLNFMALPLLVLMVCCIARHCMSHWQPTLHSTSPLHVKQTGLNSPWERYSTRLDFTRQTSQDSSLWLKVTKMTLWVQEILARSRKIDVSDVVFRTDIYRLIATIAIIDSSAQGTVQEYSSIYKSDIALFGEANAIWINHTQPTILDPCCGYSPPNNTFPFSRLASTTPAGSTYTYLYHQINGTTFAEERWDSAEGTWTTTDYIVISYWNFMTICVSKDRENSISRHGRVNKLGGWAKELCTDTGVLNGASAYWFHLKTACISFKLAIYTYMQLFFLSNLKQII